MRWDDTTASRCRYGDVVGQVFGAMEIIWEDSQADYQGSANVVGILEDGTVYHYEWSYGSCSGCDTWEANGSSDQDIMEEVERTMGKMDIDAAIRYFSFNKNIQELLRVKKAELPFVAGDNKGRFGDFE